MFARSLSLTALFALVLALFAADHVNAGMFQGNVDLTRDWVLQYSTSKFADTKAFCTRFRSACVTYVGPIGPNGSHHQLDCVFSDPNGNALQPGPRIRAFCGALGKNPDGSWTNGGPVTDVTKQLVKKSFTGSVTVKGGPISLKECKAFKKKHPAVTCSA